MIKAQFLELGRSEFKYLFHNTVTLGTLQNLSEYLCCHLLFLLYHKRWIAMKPYGFVWYFLILLLCSECSMERNEMQILKCCVKIHSTFMNG